MPTRDTPWPQGTPCWVDYSAAEPEAAKKLYGDLFGWEYQGGEEQYGGYLNCTIDGREAAGMMPGQQLEVPPSWTLYFAADDVDACVARATEKGATVVAEPMDVDPMGRMAVLVDPQGSVFGLWQAKQFPGMRVFNEHGAVTWEEATVEDVAAAKTFYADLFGYRYEAMEGAEEYYVFATSGDPLGGIGRTHPGMAKGWSVCFAVSDTDKAIATMTEAGGKVTMGPLDSPYGRYAGLEDPWGAPITVMGQNAEQPAEGASS